MIKLTINHQPIEVPDDTTVLQTARQSDHHPHAMRSSRSHAVSNKKGRANRPFCTSAFNFCRPRSAAHVQHTLDFGYCFNLRVQRQ